MTITILTKEDVEYLKHTLFVNCHWNDKLMNKFEDLFDELKFKEDAVLELRAIALSTKAPSLEQIQIQRPIQK